MKMLVFYATNYDLRIKIIIEVWLLTFILYDWINFICIKHINK